MNIKIIELTIEIIYGQEKYSITKEKHFSLEDLTRLAVDKFNIDKKLENNIVFNYKDEDGDIIKINKIEDIYKAAKQLTNSENYISIINLEISENEVNNRNNKENNIISSQSKNNTDEIFQKKLEKIDENEKKIIKLEEKIEKLSKSNNSEKKEIDKGNSNSNKYNENCEKTIMVKIENCIKNIFSLEKDNFLSVIENIKKEILLEIKKELNKDKKEKIDNVDNDFNDIKTNIIKINSNLKDNCDKINNIQNDIYNIKEKIKKIEIVENKANYKIEDINKNNNEENNLNNQNIEKPHFFGNNYFNGLTFVPMNYLYKCKNCKNCYFLNECFNSKENKEFHEHLLSLENIKNNEKNNNNEEKEIEKKNEINQIMNNIENNDDDNNKDNNNIENNNINEKNNDKQYNNKENYEINEKNIKKNNYDENKNKINKYEKKKKKNLENFNQKNEINEEDENEFDKKDYEADIIFNDSLNEYFFKKGTGNYLKDNMADERDLNKIKKVYKSFLENNVDIEIIKEIQNNYIETEIKPIINNIKYERTKNNINSRIKALENLVNNLK